MLVQQALPPLINNYINKQIALVPGSLSYPKWESPPVPIYQKFYFYNVTNAAEIEQFGQKPQLEEIGPFTYRSRWQKQEIEQPASSDASATMKFKHFKQWQFEPDLSITDHSLQLVTLNAPLAVTLTLIQSASNAVRLLVTLSLDGLSEGFFTKRSVKQLLFEGYPDLLTTFGPLLNAEMLSQGGHFGYMNARNNTIDGVYEINTGADDISKLNTIHRFNGRTRLPYWSHHGQRHNGQASSSSSKPASNSGPNSPHELRNRCDSLEGATTGEMFPPIEDEEQEQPLEESSQRVLKLFQPDFCRVWRLNFDGKYEHQSGLKLSRFKATRDIFRNATDLAENACYFKHHSSSSSSSLRHSAHAASAALAGPAASSSSSSNRVVAAATAPADPAPSRRQAGEGAGAHHSSSSAAAAAAANQRPQPSNNNNLNNVRAPHSGGGNTNNGAPSSSRVRHEWPAGVFTLGPCKFNAPIYMSMPHFLDADPHFSSQVDGLAPDPLRHEFYVDLEPRTGSPVVLAARVQLNVAISKPPGLVRFRNIPEIMFPVFWQELTVNLTGTPVIDELLLASRAQQQTIKVSYVLYLLGAVILTTAALFCLCSEAGGALTTHLRANAAS